MDHVSQIQRVKLPMGIVLRDLEAYQRLVHVLVDEPTLQSLDFTYRAPLYKGNAAIRERLTPGQRAIEKFDVYFEHGFLDADARAELAQKFHADYVRRFPKSEKSDLFFASGDVLHLGFQLKAPSALPDPDAALAAIKAEPYDDEALIRLEEQGTVSFDDLHGEVRLFLDDAYNPRRRAEPGVQKVMTGARRKNPVVVELFTSGAFPGLFTHALEPAIDEVDGALVMLDG